MPWFVISAGWLFVHLFAQGVRIKSLFQGHLWDQIFWLLNSGQVNSGGWFTEPRRSEVLISIPIYTDTEVNNCFSTITKPVNTHGFYFVKTQLEGDYSCTPSIVFYKIRQIECTI